VSRPTTTELLLAETRQYAVLTPAQEFAIATRAAKSDRKARHLLVLHNLRFANYVALQYRFTGLPHGDVLSAVYTGMLTASARFDAVARRARTSSTPRPTAVTYPTTHCVSGVADGCRTTPPKRTGQQSWHTMNVRLAVADAKVAACEASRSAIADTIKELTKARMCAARMRPWSRAPRPGRTQLRPPLPPAFRFSRRGALVRQLPGVGAGLIPCLYLQRWIAQCTRPSHRLAFYCSTSTTPHSSSLRRSKAGFSTYYLCERLTCERSRKDGIVSAARIYPAKRANTAGATPRRADE
jgi:hypothetical protein